MMNKLELLEKKIQDCEQKAMKIKAVKFTNFQSFNSVYENYEVGEVYDVNSLGYTVITHKSNKEVRFIVIMKPDMEWAKHWQDVPKTIEIKKGVYMDLFTGTCHTEILHVPAYDPSYFKSGKKDDLVIKGRIYKEK